MNAIRSISSGTERKEENCIPDKENYFINGKLEKETIEHKQENNKVKQNEDERITISISRNAYYALEAFIKEFNQGQPSNKKPLTVEEALDEEILLLFSDEWSNK
ncbi:MAG: hypothetical protein WBZ36_02955 [Candidatus Nitrosopolaris sp.]